MDINFATAFPDPYPEVYEQVEVLPYYRHGWHLHEKFKSILASGNIHVIVEIGSWVGNCTIYLAEMLPDKGTIFAVDHWLGSREHRDPRNRMNNSLLPNLFPQFLSNIIHHGLTHKVIPVRLDSLLAAQTFKELGIKPDLIYLDASHDYVSVFSDIRAWYPLLNEGGLFCGDDWNWGGSKGGVARAAKKFASQNGLKISIENELWWYENQ